MLNVVNIHLNVVMRFYVMQVHSVSMFIFVVFVFGVAVVVVDVLRSVNI